MEIEEAIPKNHKDQNMTEPQEKVERFLDKDSHKRKLAWARCWRHLPPYTLFLVKLA